MFAAAFPVIADALRKGEHPPAACAAPRAAQRGSGQIPVSQIIHLI